MRAEIYHANGLHTVAVEEDGTDYLGQPTRVKTVYFVPAAGGYVRIWDENGDHKQVCEGLSSRGNTLYLADPDGLIDLIRRERRRGMAAEKRLMRA